MQHTSFDKRGKGNRPVVKETGIVFSFRCGGTCATKAIQPFVMPTAAWEPDCE